MTQLSLELRLPVSLKASPLCCVSRGRLCRTMILVAVHVSFDGRHHGFFFQTRQNKQNYGLLSKAGAELTKRFMVSFPSQLCFVIFYNNVFTRLDVRCTWKRFSGAHTRVAGSRRGPDMVTADHSSRTLICDGASVNCGHRKVHGTIFEIC